MESIASLLFGRAAGRLLDLVTGEGGTERGMAGQVARAAEWCGSTPGAGAASRQVGGTARPRRLQCRAIVIRDRCE